MNINFAPKDESFIKAKVEQGYYSNATELVRDAVRRLRENSDIGLESLYAELEKGDADIRAGRVYEFTPELFAEIKKNGAEKSEKGIAPDSSVCP